MTGDSIEARFAALCGQHLAAPGTGCTADRHRAIFAAGREDLSLAKLIEAHWDAVAILEEAGHETKPGARYAVWASEVRGRPLTFSEGRLTGTKEFCSGAPLVNRALVTAGDALVEIDLAAAPESLSMDERGWHTEAFRATRTAAITFARYPVAAVIGQSDWYTRRTGFWQGACGPAAAWAGGAAGLVDDAMKAKRDDPHTTAHLAAMHADVWAMEATLAAAADEFDRNPTANAMIRALEVRHIVEQMATNVLRRFARALGPAPLVKDAAIARRYAELGLFLCQSHAERDLETLGRAIRAGSAS